MKKIVIVCVLFCFVFAAAFAAGSSASSGPKQVTLRYAHVGIAGESQTRYVDGFADLVKQKSNGSLIIQVFPNSQLGGANEMTDGIKSGAISMGHHEFSTLGKYLSDIAVFNAPYVFKDAKHVVAACNPKTSPVLQRLNEQLIKVAEVRVLGVVFRGFRQLSAKFPVYSPADLQGKKIRGVPADLYMSMLKGMGAIPTPVEIAELHAALLTGLVDGQENPLTNIRDQRFYEVQSHIMITNHMPSQPCVFINERIWQSLGAENQRIMMECIAEMTSRSVQWVAEEEAPVRKIMEDYGVEFIDESKGLRNDLFRQGVNAQIAIDYPNWAPIIREIQSIR